MNNDLTRQQLCAALQISESTVRRHERDGLPFTPVGKKVKRYSLDECKAWLRDHAGAPATHAPADTDWMDAIRSIAEDAFADIPEPVEKIKLDRPALIRYHANKRRAARLARTPSWANVEAIKAIYAEAARLTAATGISHHVDHKYPLQGKLVSGLHVENNLQILTASANSAKKNRFEIEP